MSGATTAKGRTRSELSGEQNETLAGIASVSGSIVALEAQLERLYPERVALYQRGVAQGISKTRMAESAGCTLEAVIHALRKAEREPTGGS